MPGDAIPATGTGLCHVIGCNSRWVTLIHAGDVRADWKEALTGLGPGEAEMLRLCRDHYRNILRKDGYTLGYRSVNGVLKAYIKEVHF